MEKEISSGTMLGIVLIALAVIIGLGFGIFSIAKGTANEGVTKVQTNLANVSSSEFQDYDQAVVTGTQVRSAYQNFEGKNVAVLIATTATIDAKDNVADGAGVKDDAAYAGKMTVSGSDKGEVQAEHFLKQAYKDKSGTAKYSDMYGSDGTEGAGLFVNYNAILNAGNTDTNRLYFDEGKFVAQAGFATKDGSSNVGFNTTVKNLGKSGMIEYLSPTSRFNSYVVKDATGSYVGVAFVQISNR